MSTITWPHSLNLHNKNYDTEDERGYRMRRRYRLLMRLVKKFYEEHWPGSWRKLRRRFKIYDLEVLGGFQIDDAYSPALDACVICEAPVSPYYQLRGQPLDSLFSYADFLTAPLPKEMPIALSFGNYLQGDTTSNWSNPEFAICVNGHAFVHFETHNTPRFGMISYHQMWSAGQKRFVAFRSDEIDPTFGTGHPSTHYPDDIAKLREEFNRPLVGEDRFSRPLNFAIATPTNTDVKEVEKIVQHMIQIGSLTNAICDGGNLAIMCPDRMELLQAQIEWLWSKVKAELLHWIAMDRREPFCSLATGIALIHPAKSKELRGDKQFSAFLGHQIKEVLEFNRDEGWGPASKIGVATRFYFPDFLKKGGAFQEALWHKGTRCLLPHFQRGFSSRADDLAHVRLIFLDRFAEVCPTGDDLLYVLRRALRDCEKSREEDREQDSASPLHFSLNAVLRQAAYLKIVTAKEVTIHPESLKLQITS